MRIVTLSITALVALSACMTGSASPSDRTSTMNPSPGATAVMHDGAGNTLGTLTVTESSAGLTTTGMLRGLTPGTHGIHLHAVGSCQAPAFTSAGGHWNPTSRMHGFDNPMGPHMGDMRNITVGDDGMAMVNTMTPGGTLYGANGLMDADGASVVVHAGPDDYRSDPAGNSGARVACGVLRS